MIGETISHYRILERLGEGGMGVVYRAEDTRLERQVAVKFLPRRLSADENAKKRFIHEAKAASSLDHPNICTIHEIDETTDGQLYIVMACYEGKTLAQLLEQIPPAVHEALGIFLQIAAGLSQAHRKGIVHRDIKPGNIIITEEGLVKIVDFGLAKLAGRTKLTKTDSTLGTAAYMSPEQARGEPVDQRTDIWSLGVVLYEMIAGKQPFYAERTEAVIYRILNEEPPPIAAVRAGLPDDLARIVAKSLAKDPARRYKTVGEFAAAVVRMAQESSIPLAQPLPAMAGPAPNKRNALTMAGIFVVLLAVVVSAGVFFIPKQSVSFNERDWVLITDFENLTGEPVFDRSLNTALTVSLQQSRHVNVFPRSRVHETLQRMGKAGADSLGEVLGGEIAQRQSLQLLIVPAISRIGEVYDLSVRIVDPVSLVALKTESARADGKDEVLGALDKLAGKVRRDLGETLASIVRRNVPLAHATTSSLDALKYLTDGSIAWENGHYEEAAKMWESAVALDSAFAWAQTSLGLYYYAYKSDRPKGDIYFDEALKNLDRVTERERLWLSALIESKRGILTEAIKILEVYLNKYPDDLAAQYNLGNWYKQSGAYKEAIDTYSRIIKAHPDHASSYINMATCYGNMGRTEESISNYETAFKLEPDWLSNPNLNHEYGFDLVEAGRPEKAESIFKIMVNKEDWTRARGYRSLALLDMYRGKYDSALGYLKQATLVYETLEYWPSALRDHLYEASCYRMKGLMSEFHDELETCRNICQRGYLDPYYLQLLAKFYAREGETEKAKQMCELIASNMNEKRSDDMAAFDLAKGETDLAGGNPAEAVRLLEAAYELREDNFVLESLAQALYQKGELDQALAKYEQLKNKKSFGWEGQECWFQALVQIGRIYEKKGDSKAAERSYAEFLALWKDADRDIPLYTEIQGRLLALRGPASQKESAQQ